MVVIEVVCLGRVANFGGTSQETSMESRCGALEPSRRCICSRPLVVPDHPTFKFIFTGMTLRNYDRPRSQ